MARVIICVNEHLGGGTRALSCQLSRSVVVVFSFRTGNSRWGIVFDPSCLQLLFATLFVSNISRKHSCSCRMKLSEQTVNGSRTTPLNSPGGSTLQRGAGRGLLCLTLLVLCYWLRRRRRRWRYVTYMINNHI